MHNEAQVIIKNLFNQSSLDKVAIEEISSITDQYPYFNAAQFLLAKKERSENDDLREGQHPVLFFNNPLWFEFLMQKDLSVSTEVLDELVLEKTGLEISSTESTNTENDYNTEPLTVEEFPNATSSKAEDKVEEDLSPKIQQQAFANEPNAKANPQPSAPLEFEPYHTIDYFASQGIRLQQSDLSKDKFGQQLKSFTEWLKSMKRIPEPQQPSQAEIHAQENVARIAEHSIESKDVNTEAMAEVWAKQGNRQKAIEIYKKLSLLNPAKSTYFAAKIEQLNS